MDKSPEAFRTISEVAEALETPAHVLRFWESRFPQIRPVKRAGGRRYYRPSDVALLSGIKRLLHEEGLTIRGVQKILREQGIRHVSGLAEEASPEEQALDAAMSARLDIEEAASPDEVEDATATALEAALDAKAPASPRPGSAPDPFPEAGAEATEETEPEPQLALFRGSAAAAVPPRVAPPGHEAPEADAAPAAPAPPPARIRRFAAAPTQDDAPTATLAGRLRALPRGSLAHKAEPLAEIAARIVALRQRLSPPHSA
ncbi:MerR family transcriptional regulator [Rhodobacter sp. Har01]|uniref:MerR family transcriptional regulator n=1 Tax=Rhodobacter sp. Har01 TaxID=2883999 RepID=UPI001D096E2B|nr:MerR family transcriptional regulator [Rhodobacter sp. Har01]MCB6177029.1 MerR family transcriptional regulator [Rhodobacter sp. Har01]